MKGEARVFLQFSASRAVTVSSPWYLLLPGSPGLWTHRLLPPPRQQVASCYCSSLGCLPICTWLSGSSDTIVNSFL